MELIEKIKALLFVAGKPLASEKLAKILGVKITVVETALSEGQKTMNTVDSGLHLLVQSDRWQLVTSPNLAREIKALTKEEVAEELTRPSLETLTIIAYRGPVTKPEIEQIRGINCSLILRNLLIRGLIEETDDPIRLQPVYALTHNFLRHLGIHSVQELPDYAELHQHESLEQVLAATNNVLPFAIEDDKKISV